MWTNLTLVTIDDDPHPLHVDSFIGNALEAVLKLRWEGLEVFRGDRTDVNWNVDTGGPYIFAEVDVRAMCAS